MPEQEIFVLIALAALVGSEQNIVFLIVLYLTSFVPVAQQAKQEVLPRHLSVILCLLK
jgi:hypothetical protein